MRLNSFSRALRLEILPELVSCFKLFSNSLYRSLSAERSETPAQSREFAFIPIVGFDQLESCSRGKDDFKH
jgi:hypothetical protein